MGWRSLRSFPGADAATESVLYAFQGGADGAFPRAGLVADKKGNLYGTTSAGGGPSDSTYCNHDLGQQGCGIVFKVALDGTETVLYAFRNVSDGAGPVAGLITDRAGNLYGTTFAGGTGGGTVFKLAPNGRETVLHDFQGGNDGGQPAGGLLADSAGNFYGTTAQGGGNADGIVYKLAPDGTETVLHTFEGVERDDGDISTAALIANKNGTLFGHDLRRAEATIMASCSNSRRTARRPCMRSARTKTMANTPMPG